MNIDPETHRLAKAVVEEFRQRKIQEFWKDTTIQNYNDKLAQWERIKHTIA